MSSARSVVLSAPRPAPRFPPPYHARSRRAKRPDAQAAEALQKHNRKVTAAHEKHRTLAESLQELEVTIDMPLVTNPGGADLLAGLQLHAVKVKLVDQPLRNAITVQRHRSRPVQDPATGRLTSVVDTQTEPWVIVRWTLDHLTAFLSSGATPGLPPLRLSALVPLVRRTFGNDVTTFLVLEGLPNPVRGIHAHPPATAGAVLDRARIDEELVQLELAGGCRVTETDRPPTTIGAIVKIVEAIAEQPYQYGREKKHSRREGWGVGRGGVGLGVGGGWGVVEWGWGWVAGGGAGGFGAWATNMSSQGS